ncbi:cytochrome b5 [Bimuria novae-zelandiae CBS 107.79]|uniref:Cytochrome b5 n=1 Tax=Bimuria novae-zelandiae CBS 107.79 TaxID=1447943 RepID=A0A6A5VUP7_9PLEO|nr:cytochrome b5 [Bimuria novae-zelandiae CBS 107.79]
MEARQRRPAPTKDEPAEPIKKVASESTSSSVSVLDILRIAGGILLFSSALSYLTTSGASLTWGYNPWWTRAAEWKNIFKPPVSLTDDELLAYDGTDPDKPIYLALNGTIYDVSISPATYGPGGSYHFFAGRDAARAFLTGCFDVDAVPDLRGVEQMYMPLEPWEKPLAADASDAEKAKHAALEKRAREKRKAMTKGDLKNRSAQELRKARQSVRDGLEHWHQLFRGDKGKAYRKVGEVKREEGWLQKLPKRTLCEQAEKGRPVRKYED